MTTSRDEIFVQALMQLREIIEDAISKISVENNQSTQYVANFKSVADAVKATINSIPKSKAFTVTDAEQAMMRSWSIPAARPKRATISQVLRRMAINGQLKAQNGKGRAPSVYYFTSTQLDQNILQNQVQPRNENGDAVGVLKNIRSQDEERIGR